MTVILDKGPRGMDCFVFGECNTHCA